MVKASITNTKNLVPIRGGVAKFCGVRGE